MAFFTAFAFERPCAITQYAAHAQQWCAAQIPHISIFSSTPSTLPWKTENPTCDASELLIDFPQQPEDLKRQALPKFFKAMFPTNPSQTITSTSPETGRRLDIPTKVDRALLQSRVDFARQFVCP